MKQKTFDHYKDELLHCLDVAHNNMATAISAADELSLDTDVLRGIYNSIQDEMNGLEDLENEP